MKIRNETKNNIDLVALRKTSAEYKTLKEITQVMGLKKNALHYLLNTTYLDADGFVLAVRKAFYEGQAEYKIKKGLDL